MKKAVLYGFLTAVAFMASVACGTKKEDKGADVGAGGGGTNVVRTQGAPNFPNMAYSAQYTNVSFQDAMVRALLSAGMDVSSSNLGQITSVQLVGSILVDRNTGNLVNTGSNQMMLAIRDTMPGQATDPIYIQLPAISGGASNGVADVTFGDNAGTIRISGNYSGTTFNGTVSFTNNTGNGYNGVRSGTLGTFSINTCSIFRCSYQ